MASTYKADACTYTHQSILCLSLFFSLSLVFIHDLVFHSHSVSSWMQASCWLFAVFCLQGPRGLVGPRGPPGPPGQPVSQHRLNYRIKAIQLLQLYKSLSGAWIIDMLLRWTRKLLNYLHILIKLWHYICCFLTFIDMHFLSGNSRNWWSTRVKGQPGQSCYLYHHIFSNLLLCTNDYWLKYTCGFFLH